MRQIAVIASGNQHKIQEMGVILQDYLFEIKSMKEVGLEDLIIVEDGKTFEENAIIKATTVMEKTGFLTVADDSGLEVDILNGLPGIYSARFSSENATDQQNNEKLLSMLKDVPIEERKARFVCAMVAAFPDGEIVSVRGECNGLIGFNPRGESGFGYDPLFIVEEYNKTFAEIGQEKKNLISHRGKALKKLKKSLNSKWEVKY